MSDLNDILDRAHDEPTAPWLLTGLEEVRRDFYAALLRAKEAEDQLRAVVAATWHGTTGCPICRGLGQAIREDRRGRLSEWPCPCDCTPPLACIAVNHRRLG